VEIREYLAARRRLFEDNLEKFLPPSGDYPQILRQAIEYSLFAGGKRLRPILVLATVEACGGCLEFGLAPAAAIEMIHTYSLIHDDLPAMDDDDLRRGKPTSHKVFGEGMAILAGDALLTHAFSVLAESQLEAGKVASLVRELSVAAGPMGMVAGQALDIQGVKNNDPNQLNYIHACKTGALLGAAVRMGAIVADASPETIQGLTEYASALGLAYQITDDILDVTESSTALGKNPGSDAKQDKQTYVTLFGLEQAEKMAAAEVQRAVGALAKLNGDFRLLHDLGLYIGLRRS